MKIFKTTDNRWINLDLVTEYKLLDTNIMKIYFNPFNPSKGNDNQSNIYLNNIDSIRLKAILDQEVMSLIGPNPCKEILGES